MMDFKSKVEALKPYQDSILFEICPGGEVRGTEYRASTISGGKGQSFSFNLRTGVWADFASGEKGSDIVSLYSKIKNINNGQALKELSDRFLGEIKTPKHNYPVVKKERPAIIKPPTNASPPQQILLGSAPTYTWCYRDGQGDPLFYVLRYDLKDKDGKPYKEFRPLSYSSSGLWVNRMWPDPRPIYNLDVIFKNSDKPILIAEGEKAADAAAKITSAYITTSWPSGAQSVSKADWTVLRGRKVILWPDADEAGDTCMARLSSILIEICQEVKVIMTDRDGGWDAADALAEGMTHDSFVAWAKPLVKTCLKPELVEVMDKETPSTQDKPQDNPDEVQVSNNLHLTYINLGLKSSSNGKIILNAFNVAKIIYNMPEFKGQIFFEEFTQKIYTTWNGPRRIWSDLLDIQVMTRLQSAYELTKIPKSTVIDGIREAAYLNRRNEVQDWMRSLKWDGSPRISEFFIRAMGAEGSDYSLAIGRNFFISIAARIMEPGCKVDTMVILEGSQGTFKSTSLQILGGKYFTEAQSNLDSKDFEHGLLGKMIVEFGELDQFRKSDNTLIKKKLSCAVDYFRPPYGREPIEAPRTCVFVGTTNKDKYLQDETGARRFWPIKVTVCDTEYIKENRDQLFAEAYRAYLNGETWYDVPEQAKDEQEARREADPYEEIIAEWLERGNPNKPWEGRKESFTTAEVWIDCLNGDPSRLDMKASKSIARSLKALGYEQVVSKDRQRKSYKIWRKNI
jgi:predicted P-loop ATPase